MILSKQELIDVFENAYEIVGQVKQLNKEKGELLKSYAEANEINPKIMKQAYQSYVTFRDGKVTTDDEDYFTIVTIIENYFAGDKEGNVSA